MAEWAAVRWEGGEGAAARTLAEQSASILASVGEVDLGVSGLLDAADMALADGDPGDARRLGGLVLQVCAGREPASRLAGLWDRLPPSSSTAEKRARAG
ncbi:MAG: hypothetical protein M3Y91_14120 [Actinomycetota bacterium]|nr:hypothetical protein [Actinomycetota bacterium]